MGRRKTAGRSTGLTVNLKRVYDPPSGEDGPRILVDRLWPRGMTKAQLKIDAWMRDLAPSHALRRWFGHDPARWEAFRRRYLDELAANASLLDELAARARANRLTLVYSARDRRRNQAVVIREALARRRGRSRPRPRRSQLRPGRGRRPAVRARRR
jgi:uncharacterized protein YeaO (DUF488 family)